MTVVDQAEVERMDVGGSQLQFLAPPELIGKNGYSIMRGTLPAGGIVPLHSHPDPEMFYVLSGQMEAYQNAEGHDGKWKPVLSGGLAIIPGSTKHAWRNSTSAECVCIVFTGSDVCHFLQEIAHPFDPEAEPRQMDPESASRMLELAKSYGHWLGSQEENEYIGIRLGT